jgi:outer membrane usher protein FimD/PapC
VYLTGLPPEGQLVAKWGGDKQCQLTYTLPGETDEASLPGGIVTMKGICRGG